MELQVKTVKAKVNGSFRSEITILNNSTERYLIIVISISRNGHLKSCARFIIERSEIRKKQHDFKCVHFECRMVLFYAIWDKSRRIRLFSIECRNSIFLIEDTPKTVNPFFMR